MHTSDETFETIKALWHRNRQGTLLKWPKLLVLLLTAFLSLMINEVVTIVQGGVASPADVDTAMKLGANHFHGTLALGDLIWP